MIKEKTEKIEMTVIYAVLIFGFLQVATFGVFSITDIWMALTRG